MSVKWTPSEDACLVREYRSGTLTRVIGQSMDRSTKSVMQRLGALRKLGVDLPERNRKSPVDVDALNRIEGKNNG